MKRRKMTVLWVLLLAMTLLAGCKRMHKIPYGAMKDLMMLEQFTMAEGSSIVDFRITDRQTDDAAGVDQFELHVDIDHPAASDSRAYQMEYVYEDHSWKLNSCEELTQWREVTPKAEPSQEEIIRLLRTSSDEQIAAAFAELEISDSRSRLRCFSESYYDASVHPGTMVDDNRYNFFIEAEHLFELAVSEEIMLLKLEFDPDSYTWVPCGDVSLDTQMQWGITGSWESPNGDMQLYIGRVDGTEEFSFSCTMDGQTVNTTASLSDLSHQSLNPSVVRVSRMDGKPPCLDLEIGPDMIRCHDRIASGSWDMVAVDVEKVDGQLAHRGFRFVVPGEDTARYQAAADRVMEMLDMRDLGGLMEITFIQETIEMAFKLAEAFNSDQIEGYSMTHCTTEYHTESSPSSKVRSFMETAKEVIPDLQAVSRSLYLLEIEQNGELKYYLLEMIMAHGEEADYLIHIE